MLVFGSVAFVSISGAGFAGGIAFSFVDVIFGKDFFYFGLVNVPAGHAAFGVFGINERWYVIGAGTGAPGGFVLAGR